LGPNFSPFCYRPVLRKSHFSVREIRVVGPLHFSRSPFLLDACSFLTGLLRRPGLALARSVFQTFARLSFFFRSFFLSLAPSAQISHLSVANVWLFFMLLLILWFPSHCFLILPSCCFAMFVESLSSPLLFVIGFHFT